MIKLIRIKLTFISSKVNSGYLWELSDSSLMNVITIFTSLPHLIVTDNKIVYQDYAQTLMYHWIGPCGGGQREVVVVDKSVVRKKWFPELLICLPAESKLFRLNAVVEIWSQIKTHTHNHTCECTRAHTHTPFNLVEIKEK